MDPVDRVIMTKDGIMSLEDYVAAVVTAENGGACMPALRAQAVAARTFVLRAMRDDPALGTAKKPIESTERFQVYAAHAKPRSQRATWETTGIVCRYQGELILCNYVAGALWGTDGRTDEDPTHTEKWVTYNDGKTGHDVKPSPISNTSRSDNRGCKGQNAADWLGRNGHEYPAILRYFYGADLDVGPLDPKTPTPTIPVQPTPMQAPPPAKSASDPAPLVMLAALAMNVFGGDKT